MENSDKSKNISGKPEVMDPEWEKIHYSEYDPDSLIGLDLSITEEESSLQKAPIKKDKFIIGPFEPAPLDYSHYQDHKYICDGRYLAIEQSHGARFYIGFTGFFFFGMTFIIPFIWVLVSLGSWGFHAGFLPELIFIVVVSSVSYVISSLLTFFAKKIKGLWTVFDRITGLVYVPPYKPGGIFKNKTPGTTIAFHRFFGVVRGLINWMYGGSAMHGMLIAPYYPKGFKPGGMGKYHEFLLLGVDGATNDGVAGFPETYTMLCHFMDKTKPYPDSLRRMIQLYQDKGTYINGKPLKEEDVINEKLYDFKLERVINPCGIMYKYINECLENNKPVDYDRFIPNLKKSYRDEYPIFKIQDKPVET
jgi:hypothetical protein